jgi:anti-sigma factor RsiW
MSRPVEEFEISALIDCQLDPGRASEVRSAIEADPSLRAQYQRLAAADQAWTAAGRSAGFMPAVILDRTAPAPSSLIAATATLGFLLAVVRLLAKAFPLDLPVGILVHGLMLAVVVAAVLWVARSPSYAGMET